MTGTPQGGMNVFVMISLSHTEVTKEEGGSVAGRGGIGSQPSARRGPQPPADRASHRPDTGPADNRPSSRQPTMSRRV